MISKYFLILNILCIFTLASGSPSAPPHMEVTLHEVAPSPICTLGTGITPEDSISTVTLVLEGVGDPIPLDVIFSIDYSLSMNKSDPERKRLNAAKKFLGLMNPDRDRAGLVIWNEDVDKSALVNLTNEFGKINAVLDMDISPDGATNYNSALNKSINLLNDSGGTGAKKCIIFLSDGCPDAPDPDSAYTPPDDSESLVLLAKKKGIEIWTVGYSIGPKGEMILEEIADTTGGKYYRANNITVEDVFIQIYRNMTMLAGKDITVRYLAPADLFYSIDHDGIEGADKRFIWKPTIIDSNGPRNHFYIGDKWCKRFNVCSEDPGWFILGKSPGSVVDYTMYDERHAEISIEDRALLVIPCNGNLDRNKIKIRDIYVGNEYNVSGTNINIGSGSIDNDIDGKDINFGSGSIYNNCSAFPEADDKTREGVIYINIPQTAIFGSVPRWNETNVPSGVINLTVQRPETTIYAIFAFDVSGSMRSYYESMNEDGWAVLAESNFSNVSIIGWDEDAERLMAPPRPLKESEKTVLDILENLSLRCDETDLTIYDAGLEGVLDVDDDFGSLLDGDEKVVFFITGPDEFRPGDNLDEHVETLKRRGYTIYAVGVDIDRAESPLKYDALSRMTSLTGGEFYPITELSSDELKGVFRNITVHCSERAVPKDVVVTETFPAFLEVKETVPPDVDLVENPDGTTLKWVAKNMSPGEARTLVIFTAVKSNLLQEGYNTTFAAGSLDIHPKGGDAAGVNVINLRSDDGDVKLGVIS